MASYLGISIAILVCLIALTGFFWQFTGIKAKKTMGRKKGGRSRRSDKRKLSPHEKKIFSQAQDFLSEGKIPSAAQLFESIGMQREAITILENSGMVHEAAKILMRMGKHNRAGVVYARHGYWDRAADSFRMADMPLEVAKCAREAGNISMAAEYFVKANRYKEAGEMFADLGKHRKASKFFTKANELKKAMAQYKIISKDKEELKSISFEKIEVKNIAEYISNGHVDEDLGTIVAWAGKMVPVLLKLLSKGMGEQAVPLYKIVPTDPAHKLLAEVDYEDSVASEELAKLFLFVDEFNHAGVVYERRGEFDRAGEAFGRGGDQQRAIYCFERAGNADKVKEIKSKDFASKPKKSRKPLESGEAVFSMRDVSGFGEFQVQNTEFEDHESDAIDEEIEQTQIVEARVSEIDEENHSNGSEDDFVPPVPEIKSEPERNFPPMETLEDIEGNIDSNSKNFEPTQFHQTEEDPVVESNDHGLADEERLGDYPETQMAQMEFPKANSLDISVSEFENGDSEQPFSFDSLTPSQENLEDKLNFQTDLAPAVQGSNLGTDGEVGLQGELTSLEWINDDNEVSVFVKARFFSDLNEDQKMKLWQIGQSVEFENEQTILNYNDEPLGVYILLSGQIGCYREEEERDSYIDTMNEGETFGELWLLTGHPTAVKFVAEKSTRLRIIERESFNKLLDKDGAIARKVYKRFTSRLLKRLLKPEKYSGKKIAS